MLSFSNGDPKRTKTPATPMRILPSIEVLQEAQPSHRLAGLLAIHFGCAAHRLLRVGRHGQIALVPASIEATARRLGTHVGPTSAADLLLRKARIAWRELLAGERLVGNALVE